MKSGTEQFALRVISGEARGAGATLLRALVRAAEPGYRAITAARNWLYDIGALKQVALPQPVISVGNLTTGGTGKTPVVIWLVNEMRTRGHRPAVLLRGYRSGDQKSDEAMLLEESLNPAAARQREIPVCVGADRFESGAAALREQPATDLFILDDGFQHRRVRRDFDLVLLDATNPFGHGHVLPYGLMRESPAGLSRADAIVVTRSDQVETAELDHLRQEIRRHNSAAPVYLARHVFTGIIAGDGLTMPIEQLRNRRVLIMCGIGNPQSFRRQLVSAGGIEAGAQLFPDHHHYTPTELQKIQQSATAAGAQAVVTTEKDWVKLRDVASAASDQGVPIWRVGLSIDIQDAESLVRSIEQRLTARPASSPAASAGAACETPSPAPPTAPQNQSGQ